MGVLVYRLMLRFVVSLLFVCSALGQRLDPVTWSLSLDQSTAAPGSRVSARLAAKIDPGWHLYSLSTPPGPIPTSVGLQDNVAIEGFQVYQPRPTVAFDPNFKANTETFENEVVFVLAVGLRKDAPASLVDLEAQVRYQACDARQCLLPVRKTAAAQLRVDPLASGAAISIPAGYSLFESGASNPARAVLGRNTEGRGPGVDHASTPAQSGTDADSQERANFTPRALPEIGEEHGTGPAAPAPGRRPRGGSAQGLGMFVLIAFGFGLAAIFTPCVFPMIPITVSYFLNRQSSSRSQSIFHAGLFSLGIIFLFSALGLATTAILGPFGTVQLGSSPWVNAFIALVFLTFGLSLLGAFEIAIPSSVLTRVNEPRSEAGFWAHFSWA